MITVVDYGMGNLGSVKNMLKYLGYDSIISSEPKEIENAKKIILPGVGFFDKAMQKLESLKLISVLNEKALIKKTPILGICLGMQLLTYGSEEGVLPGLGWIPARTVRFPRNNGLKVPHMGWNLVKPVNGSTLTQNLPDVSRFYFVHSYYVTVENQTNSVLKTNYGVEFDAAIQNDNIFGTQFHPEKSHKFGMQILKNFARL